MDPAARRRAGPPERDVDAFVVEPIGQLADRRHADLDDVDPGRRQHPGFARPDADLGRTEGGTDPRLVGVADDREELEPGGPVRVDPVERGQAELPGRRLDRRPPFAVVQDLSLETEVDRARGDVEGELLGRRLVFEQGGRERQDDPTGQPIGPAADVAIHDLGRERSTRSVEPGHARTSGAGLAPARRSCRSGRARPRHRPASRPARRAGRSVRGRRVRSRQAARARRSSSVRSTGKPGTTRPSRPWTVSATNSASTTASSVASTAAMKNRSRNSSWRWVVVTSASTGPRWMR